MNSERVTLTFEAMPDSRVPVTCRVRSLLKHALRSLRLKCVSVSTSEREQTPRKATEQGKAG